MAEVRYSSGSREVDDIFLLGFAYIEPPNMRTRLKEWAVENKNRVMLALSFLGLAFLPR